jgi:hypothetical protein
VHGLDLPVESFRAHVRRQFEKNRYLTSRKLIDALILQGTQDLIEAVSLHSQMNHIMDAFDAQAREDYQAFQASSLRLVIPENLSRRQDAALNKHLLPDSQNTASPQVSKFLFTFLRRNNAASL